MPDIHLWITGARRTDCAAAAAGYQPDISVDGDRRLRGPYTGTGSLMRALVPQVHARQPELTARHAIEILAVAPELEPLIGPAPDTLTASATAQERTRWYSRFRTRRIAQGIVDFLRECAADGPLTLAFGSADQADQTDVEFLSIALRRLDPARVRFLVCSAREVPGLGDVLAAFCRRQAADDPSAGQRPEAGVSRGSAAAFVGSDATSDVPEDYQAYMNADPQLRAQLHDKRAAELEDRGEWSLRLGAIPYHLEQGSFPATAARQAVSAAIDYCLGMGFYNAGLEFSGKLAAVLDYAAEPDPYCVAYMQMAQCLTQLERSAETEPIYCDLMSRSAGPHLHMTLSYLLGMLYTRQLEPGRKNHHKARAYVNTAVAIASQFEDLLDRVFHTVFMNNGKALIEMHLGNLEESLRLVNDGISQLDRALPPDRHRLHHSVLHHNRAQVLAALGRHDEALADFGHVIEADPNYPEYHFDRGNLLYKIGRHAEALADYETAMRLGPPFPELYYNRGDLLAATGDIDGAMSDFRYVLDLEPDHLEARVSLASLLLDVGDPHAASAQVRHGLEATPGEARLYCTLGLALLDLAETTAAREAFSRAIELDPGLAEALVNRAIAAYEEGDYDAATSDLTNALETDTANPDLLFNRGIAREAAGLPDEAIADYTLALEDPRADRAALLYQRGRCHAALARPEAARSDLAAHLALGNSPHEQEIRDLLMTCGAPAEQ